MKAGNVHYSCLLQFLGTFFTYLGDTISTQWFELRDTNIIRNSTQKREKSNSL